MLRNHLDLEDQTPLLNPVNLVCTQRETEVDHESFQSTSYLCRRKATTGVTKEKANTHRTTCQSITAWSSDLEGRAEQRSACSWPAVEDDTCHRP